MTPEAGWIEGKHERDALVFNAGGAWSMRELAATIANGFKGNRVILWADCCFSGGLELVVDAAAEKMFSDNGMRVGELDIQLTSLMRDQFGITVVIDDACHTRHPTRVPLVGHNHARSLSGFARKKSDS